MMAEGYKETEIGVIPVEWEVAKLSEVCKFKQGIQIPIEEQDTKPSNDKIRFLRISDYTQNTDDIRYVSKEYSNYIISNDDIVMVRYGETAGFIGTNLSGILANNLFSINPNKQITKRYLYTYMNDEKIYNYLKSLRAAGAMPAVSFKSLNIIKIPLPPLKEQEKIADILSTADEKIDAITSQIQKAETLKKGLLQKLLSEGIGHSEFKDSEIGKIPESWEVVEFGKHLDVKSGFGFKAADYSQNGIPLVKIDNVSYGKIIWENTTYLPTDFTEKYQELVLSKDDILLALNRPITQNKLKMAILKEKDAPSILYQRVGKILFDETYFYKFVYYMLYHYVYDFVVHHSVGTDQPFINITKIRKLLIPLPPLEEQKQIADILSTADEKLEVLIAKKEKYETLKKGLLQKLLSGEVRV